MILKGNTWFLEGGVGGVCVCMYTCPFIPTVACETPRKSIVCSTVAHVASETPQETEVPSPSRDI